MYYSAASMSTFLLTFIILILPTILYMGKLRTISNLTKLTHSQEVAEMGLKHAYHSLCSDIPMKAQGSHGSSTWPQPCSLGIPRPALQIVQSLGAFSGTVRLQGYLTIRNDMVRTTRLVPRLPLASFSENSKKNLNISGCCW